MIDYSCYITIVNNSDQPMQIAGDPAVVSGIYASQPASSLAPGDYTSFQMTVDKQGNQPSGSCIYYIGRRNGGVGAWSQVTFTYACPAYNNKLNEINVASASIVGGPLPVDVNIIPDPLPQAGQPVSAQFYMFNPNLTALT